MQKVCAHCSAGFEITSADLALYDRLAPEFGGKKFAIPPPKRCPGCRQQRRLLWRNERHMYRRTCDFTGESIISMYPPDSPFKIYEQDIWWSDRWNALSYGRDFDFSKPFFGQFRELQLEVPRLALVNKHSENAKFTNHSADNKNCYLSAVTFESEDIYYSDWVVEHCRDLVDCSYMLEGSELCYETYCAWGCYRTFFSEFMRRCRDCFFCFDCINCKNCFLCTNLRNKEYCFENMQCSKEEYEKKMKNIIPLSASTAREFRARYRAMKDTRTIHPAVVSIQAIDSSGDLIFQCENCAASYDIIGSKDCRHCYSVIDLKDSMDNYHIGWAELMYECHAISNGYRCFACHFTYDNRDAFYCDCTQNCRDVFGCCGLNQKQYCILNKQYTKDAYEALVPRIMEHMQKTGEWGEFFPPEYSPFAYNQSRAPEFYPLTEKEAATKGFRWSTYEQPPPDAPKIIPASGLPELTADTPDDVLNWAIRCEVTDVPFKLIKAELDFYRRMELPIPRRHPNQRYEDRFAMRTPWKLWERACGKCGKAIETTHQPSRPEIVYCESCYLAEIY